MYLLKTKDNNALYNDVKAVIFDLDGTLAYTLEDLRDAMNHAMRTFGWHEKTLDEILMAINYGGRQFVKNCMPADLSSDEELAAEVYKAYYGNYSSFAIRKTVLYDGMGKLVDKLCSMGIPVCLCTNKEISLACRIMDKLLPGKFAYRVGDGTVGRDGRRFPTKPDPSGALLVCEELGISPENVLYIGDSVIDMKTAKNAGMRSIWVSWGYSKREMIPEEFAPDVTANEPGDIERYILDVKKIFSERN